jgi:hypothetical protein
MARTVMCNARTHAHEAVVFAKKQAKKRAKVAALVKKQAKESAKAAALAKKQAKEGAKVVELVKKQAEEASLVGGKGYDVTESGERMHAQDVVGNAPADPTAMIGVACKAADGDCDDWESHPFLAGFDEEAVARVAETGTVPTCELPGTLLVGFGEAAVARVAGATAMPCELQGATRGVFIGEIFCAWAPTELPGAACGCGFFVGEEFCPLVEWAGSRAKMRPSHEDAAARQHEQDAARQREQEAARQREQEAAQQREQDAARQREQEAARQREQEAARQREQEAARQREQEAARQREQAAARQHEQEAPHYARALGLVQRKPEPLRADTEWKETASVASSRTTVRHTARTVVCIICGQVGHDANTGCLKGLCFRCKRPGHVAAKCPQVRHAKSRKQVRG